MPERMTDAQMTDHDLIIELRQMVRMLTATIETMSGKMDKIQTRVEGISLLEQRVDTGFSGLRADMSRALSIAEQARQEATMAERTAETALRMGSALQVKIEQVHGVVLNQDGLQDTVVDLVTTVLGKDGKGGLVSDVAALKKDNTVWKVRLSVVMFLGAPLVGLILTMLSEAIKRIIWP